MKKQPINRAKTIKLMKISELKPSPKNPNKHSEEQIERLAEIIRYQGFRAPVIVSTLSGFVVAGHGRIEAAKKLGMKEVPVSLQDFDDETQEYAAIVSDNSIASWSDLDFKMINIEVPELGPDFDIDLLGIKDFGIDPSFKPGTEDDQGQLDQNQMTKCPNCGKIFDHVKNRFED